MRRSRRDTDAGGVDAGSHAIDANLLPMLGVDMLAGRNIEPVDGADTPPVAVVSRSLAMMMGGPEQAIGQHVSVEDADSAAPPRNVRIIGVAKNVAYDGLAEQETRRYVRYADAADPRAARHDVYLALAQFPSTVVSIGAFTDSDPASVIPSLQKAVADIAPASAVHWTGTMDDEVALEYASTRFYTVLVSALSASATALTSIGLFGLLSHAAARRTGEMGLRRALGASGRSIAGLLLGSALWRSRSASVVACSPRWGLRK
ncbi:MAG: ABC transporter permease [Acidobacteria bacterium]|nr:ABC transporter permease [Acidobacteriota bacterium]